MQNKIKKSLSGLAVVALLAAGNHFFPELFQQLEQQHSSTSFTQGNSQTHSSRTDSNAATDKGFSTLQAAVTARRSEVWFDETEFEVVKILPDDLKGSQHQRFLVVREGLPTLLVAHNIDLAPRAPIREHDDILIRGRYEWNEKGGVIHWTHHDPKGYIDGGWIRVNGKQYD